MRSFELLRPTTIAQAVDALAAARGEPGSALALAGGQDLLTELRAGVAAPALLVDLKRVPELASIDESESDHVLLGALATLDRLESGPLARRFPLLAQAAATVASPQVRNQATLGGNLCQRPRCPYYRLEHAACLKKGGTECFARDGRNATSAILGGGPSYIVHPSDLAPALMALDAELEIAGATGARWLALEDFFTLPSEADVRRENVLGPAEIVTRVRVPKDRSADAATDGWQGVYLKLAERSALDFALSAVALALRTAGGRIREARLVLGGVAPRPWRCRSTEALLEGRPIDEETCRAAAEDALRDARPLAENGYKVPMTRGLITKALRRLAAS